MNKRGKVIASGIIALIAFFIIMSLYLALADTGTTKSYDADTKIVTIKNNGAEIANIKLESPEIVYVIAGRDRRVAEFTLNSKEVGSITDFLSRIEFYNKRDMTPTDRNFTLKLKVSKEVTTPVYERKCDEENFTDKSTGITYTFQVNCTNTDIISYNKKDIVNTWEEIPKDFPTGENVTIGIFTDVYNRDYVEWIPTFYGVQISEWAGWTEVLNQDLFAYYKFEDANDSINGYNLTIVGTPTYEAGLIANAGNITAPTNMFNISDSLTTPYLNFPDAGWSIVGWARPTKTDTFEIIFSKSRGTTGYYMALSSGMTVFAGEGSDCAELDSLAAMNVAEVWRMFAITSNSSNLCVYVNDTITCGAGNCSLNTNDVDLRWGAHFSELYPYTGLIDEIGFWNRTLTSDEITQLYNNGEGITYEPPFVDTTAPNITIVSPLNDTYLTSAMNFNVTAEDNIMIAECWYSLDEGANNISLDNDTASNYYNTSSSIIKGSYTTNFYCNDTAGNVNDTEEVTFVKLNSLPTQDTPVLSTPSASHPSNENLTCENISTDDLDGDSVVSIFNWIKDGASLLSLNMPLETDVTDYSGNENNGTINGNPEYVNGKYGKALEFDEGEYIFIQDSDTLDFTDKKTWQLWFRRNSSGEETLFDKSSDEGINYKLEFLNDDRLKFSYSVIPGTFYYSWQVNDETDFDGDYNQTIFNTSTNKLTLDNTSIEQQFFFDGFESGSFATNSWISYADSVNWSVSANDSFEGTYHAGIIDTGNPGDKSTIEVSINTLGFSNINVSYKVQRLGLDADDNFTAEYFNGTDYVVLESGGNVDDLTYQDRSFVLSSDANNNPDLKIRFSCVGAGPGEGCRIDNVELRGEGFGFVSSGEYTSKVFDSGKISKWLNLTWQEELATSTELVFQIRSCDDSICSGETFVGPDNTSNTNFTNADLNNISFIEENQYFQFKAFLSTANFTYSPNLLDVSIDYSQTIENNETNITSTTAISNNDWHLATITYDNVNKNLSLYINDSLEASSIEPASPAYANNNLTIAKFFNGSIDEFRIYNYSLSQEQIANNYLLKYDTIVSEETSGGDNWICQVTPNDGEEDGLTKNSNELEILVAISFNVIDSYSNASLDGVIIACNYSGFNQSGDTTNTYGPYGFPPGNYECNFSSEDHFPQVLIFNADIDEIKTILMPLSGFLSIEEHTWLEAIYNCIVLENCSLYNLLLEMNNTLGNIWEQTKPTDESVIAFENITQSTVNSSNNLTIDYTVNIPIKAGYGAGDYLPVRIGFWFLDENNETCYNQGDKPTGVEEPYCQPLIVETIGPMGGSVSFTARLQPSLPAGDYSIKRIIDIDPNNLWINYGQESIGVFQIIEAISNSASSLEKTGEVMPSSNSPSQGSSSSSGGRGGSVTNNIYNTYVIKPGEGEKEKPNSKEETSQEKTNKGITGGVIGTSLFSGGQIVTIIAILCGLFALAIVCKTIGLKKK